jgi:magnesium transporter
MEMANVYSNILNGTMDFFNSIISNNLNIVVSRLTSVTIILMIPTIIASFFGMNVPLPFSHDSFSFIGIIVVSVLISGLLTFWFRMKKWL